MKLTQRTAGLTLVSVGLVLATGCNTSTGAFTGGAVGGVLGGVIGHATGNTRAGILIGAASGAVAGGIIGHLNAQQQARLRQQSPQTLATIQHNDEVLRQQAAQPQPVSSPPQPVPAQPQIQPEQPQPSNTAPPQGQPQPDSAQTQNSNLIPLTVEDVKALAAAGVKPEVIIDEIGKSKSVYSQQDIAMAQQANPPVDPSVLDFMKKTKPN